MYADGNRPTCRSGWAYGLFLIPEDEAVDIPLVVGIEPSATRGKPDALDVDNLDPRRPEPIG